MTIDPHEFNKFKRHLYVLRLKQKMRNYLRIFPLYERRTDTAHYIGNRRSTWIEKLEERLGIEPPSSTRDRRVNIIVAVATIQVTIIILATATVRPENILLIPTFCLYAAAMLAYRKYRLNRLSTT